MDTSLKIYKITWAKLNQIRLMEPLQIQTIQPEKYLKYSNEFQYDGHILPILISYKVIHHTCDIYRDNSIYDPSYSYNILSHLSISGDWRYASLLTIAVTILLGEATTNTSFATKTVSLVGILKKDQQYTSVDWLQASYKINKYHVFGIEWMRRLIQ